MIKKIRNLDLYLYIFKEILKEIFGFSRHTKITLHKWKKTNKENIVQVI